MQIGFIGLGRMGANMVKRLLPDGHTVVGFDHDPEVTALLTQGGFQGAGDLPTLVKSLDAPRTIWMMVPSGETVTETIKLLLPHLSEGDLLIDGGNSLYKDSMTRAETLKKEGIHFMDVGTSGGIWGLTVGYCMMIGGEKPDFERLDPVFKTLAPKEGYLYCGKHGSGHFTKMIHNGIEYAMLQAYGEGFALLEASQFDLDMAEVSKLWNRGSVIRSWLLELAEDAFEKDPHLETFKGHVNDSGEGRWTVLEAVESGVPAPTIAASLFARFSSRNPDAFSDKFISALRKEFGGHAAKRI